MVRKQIIEMVGILRRIFPLKDMVLHRKLVVINRMLCLLGIRCKTQKTDGVDQANGDKKIMLFCQIYGKRGHVALRC